MTGVDRGGRRDGWEGWVIIVTSVSPRDRSFFLQQHSGGAENKLLLGVLVNCV